MIYRVVEDMGRTRDGGSCSECDEDYRVFGMDDEELDAEVDL